jgi:WD40 repeat protein
VGIEHGPIVSNSGGHLNPHSHAIENYTKLPSSDTPVSALQGLTVQYLDTSKLNKKPMVTVINEPLLSPSDRISGVTYLADGTLLVVINPDSGSAKGAEPSRLLLLKKKKHSDGWDITGPVYVSGLSKDQGLDSPCLLRSGKLIAMVTLKDGSGPAYVVEVHPEAGTVTKLFSLPTDRRFSTLAEAPNGKLYTSVFRNNGTTELWTLDMTSGNADFLKGLITRVGCTTDVFCLPAPVDTPWYHGLQSLIVTPAGQVLAHGNLEYFLPDSLYSIDVATGVMTEIASYPVARTALSKQAV